MKKQELLAAAMKAQGSSSKTPVAKPNGTKMFRSVFLNNVKKWCFFAIKIVYFYCNDVYSWVILWKSYSMVN